MKTNLLLSALLSISAIGLGSSMSAQAEGGCPSGYVPTPNQGQPCAADYNLPHWNQQQQSQPQAQWADRWGAISVDDKNAVVGVSTSKSSKNLAQKSAISDCTTRGGNDCQIQISYTNQCAALVAADHGYNTPTLAKVTHFFIINFIK